MDTCKLNQLQKLEQTIYNIRLFMKVICTVWKLVIKPDLWRPTGFLQCFDTVGLVIWPVKSSPEMSYSAHVAYVSSGTLNHTHSLTHRITGRYTSVRLLVVYRRHVTQRTCAWLCLELLSCTQTVIRRSPLLSGSILGISVQSATTWNYTTTCNGNNT